MRLLPADPHAGGRIGHRSDGWAGWVGYSVGKAQLMPVPMPVPFRIHLLDPQIITAAVGYDVVRLQLKPGVQLANARDLEDVTEIVEPIVAWVTQVAVFDEGIAKGTAQSASVTPVT